MASNFQIIRKDLSLDPVLVQSDGLTIGRLIGNDLVLNHPTVSRTQAGIKELDAEFWIFNLSAANGTILNGELIESSPLADGDIVQIGPFFLTLRYVPAGIQLSVELSVAPLRLDAAQAITSTAATEGVQDKDKTVRLDLAAFRQRQKTTPKGTRRLSTTGMLTARLNRAAEMALRVFWDKRKREAGKLIPDSPLMPKEDRRPGKSQFNWRPTRDLTRSWRPSVFVWSVIIVLGLSATALAVYMDAFSPGDISTAHERVKLSMAPAIAQRANGTSCSNCHSVTARMEENCVSCHRTPAFEPSVSDIHTKAGLTCITCHTEHKGRDANLSIIAEAACVNCHRDGSTFISPLGRPLKTPHGGTVGYPVLDAEWKWAGIPQSAWSLKKLPGTPTNYTIKEQFHLVHLNGTSRGEALCSDCHSSGVDAQTVARGVRESCSRCHATDATPLLPISGRGAESAMCTSCHAQHGTERNLRASRRQSVL